MDRCSEHHTTQCACARALLLEGANANFKVEGSGKLAVEGFNRGAFASFTFVALDSYISQAVSMRPTPSSNNNNIEKGQEEEIGICIPSPTRRFRRRRQPPRRQHANFCQALHCRVFFVKELNISNPMTGGETVPYHCARCGCTLCCRHSRTTMPLSFLGLKGLQPVCPICAITTQREEVFDWLSLYLYRVLCSLVCEYADLPEEEGRVKMRPTYEQGSSCATCKVSLSGLLDEVHHCRNCGLTFCHVHATRSVPLPHYNISKPKRVCDECLRELGIARHETTEAPESKLAKWKKAARGVAL